MVSFIQRRGFVGILLLASWPNAAFDLCGLCCGAFRMPFWQFFGATFLGKSVVKINGQVGARGGGGASGGTQRGEPDAGLASQPVVQVDECAL